MTAPLERRLRPLLDDLLTSFRVLIVQGARQVGKSTLVRDLAARRSASFVDLDDPFQLESLRQAVGVLRPLARPVVIDEVQRGGPSAVLAVKRLVARRSCGTLWG
jgi:hypothetical protein